MKNIIEHFYNINIDKICLNENVYYFYYKNFKYYFIEFTRSIEDLNSLVEISNNLYNNKILVHTFISNINNEFLTNYDNKYYTLLRVNRLENEEVDLKDIINLNFSIISNSKKYLYKNDWYEKWCTNVDNFERQVIEYNKEYPKLQEVFNYYIGLAETAISYLKNHIGEDKYLVLSHYRLKYPVKYGDIYNPINFIFDIKTRDIAEYMKINFFFGKYDSFEAIKFIKSYNLKIPDLYSLVARLLYPTYYFDIFIDIINGKNEMLKLNKIIKLSREYELFLRDILNYLTQNYNIEPIEWLKNIKMDN